MKTLLALAVFATASLTTTAYASDASDFDFASQATALDQGPEFDLDNIDMGNTRPMPVTRSIHFAVVARGHKPDEAFSKVTEGAKTICSKHKGSVRNLHYFPIRHRAPRDGGMALLDNEANRPTNALGVRVSCALGRK